MKILQTSGIIFRKSHTSRGIHNWPKADYKYYSPQIKKKQSNIADSRSMIWGKCVSTLLRAIVLQTYSPTECINSPTCRVESPTGLFLQFLVLQTIGPTQQ